MTKKLLGAVLVLLLVALAGATVPLTDVLATTPLEEHQDPPPDDGTGGGSTCTYCDDQTCGCDTPPTNCVLYSSCGCSSVDCWRSCTPVCY